MGPEENQIKEIHPGIFHTTLWCPDAALFSELIPQDSGYVFIWDHQIGKHSWQQINLPLGIDEEPIPLQLRVGYLQILLKPEQFRKHLHLFQHCKAVHFSSVPPDFLDLSIMKSGPALYKLLLDHSFSVLIATNSIDFGWILSPVPETNQRAIQLLAERR
tara:strand:- start:86 stop:565 length:480 start_codon:yes stop_codon:yes gene_type:complete